MSLLQTTTQSAHRGTPDRAEPNGSRLLKLMTAGGRDEGEGDEEEAPVGKGATQEGAKIKVSTCLAREDYCLLILMLQINIEDNDDVGDERIQASQLRRLLMNRPDLSKLLYSCIEEEGLLHYQPPVEEEQEEY